MVGPQENPHFGVNPPKDEEIFLVADKIPQIKPEEIERVGGQWTAIRIRRFLENSTALPTLLELEPNEDFYAVYQMIGFNSAFGNKKLETFNPNVMEIPRLEVEEAMKYNNMLLERNPKVANLGRLFVEVRKIALMQS